MTIAWLLDISLIGLLLAFLPIACLLAFLACYESGRSGHKSSSTTLHQLCNSNCSTTAGQWYLKWIRRKLFSFLSCENLSIFNTWFGWFWYFKHFVCVWLSQKLFCNAFLRVDLFKPLWFFLSSFVFCFIVSKRFLGWWLWVGGGWLSSLCFLFLAGSLEDSFCPG